MYFLLYCKLCFRPSGLNNPGFNSWEEQYIFYLLFYIICTGCKMLKNTDVNE